MKNKEIKKMLYALLLSLVGLYSLDCGFFYDQAVIVLIGVLVICVMNVFAMSAFSILWEMAFGPSPEPEWGEVKSHEVWLDFY